MIRLTHVICIEIQTGLRQGRVVSLLESLVIGRDPHCDLRLPDPRVSRRHCLLTPTEDGGVLVKDLSSKNGTFVDNARIGQVELTAGAVFLAGSVQIAICHQTPCEDEGPLSRPSLHRRLSSIHLFSPVVKTLELEASAEQPSLPGDAPLPRF